MIVIARTLAPLLCLLIPTFAFAQSDAAVPSDAVCTAAWMQSPASAVCTATVNGHGPGTCMLDAMCPNNAGVTVQDLGEVQLSALPRAKNCDGTILFRQPCTRAAPSARSGH